jgi:hypothetical protein
VWLDFVTDQISVLISVAWDRAVELRRGACARSLIFIRNAVDRLRAAILIDRRRATTRAVGRFLAEYRIVAGIRRAIDSRFLLRPRAFLRTETDLLGGDARRHQTGNEQN